MMLNVGQYDSSSDEANTPDKHVELPPPKKVVAAPHLPQQFTVQRGLIKSASKEVAFNVQADVMWAPLVGPVNPNTQLIEPTNNIVTGHVEYTSANDYNFDEKYYEHRRSYLGDNVLGKRKSKGKANDVESFQGPWASYEAEEVVQSSDDEDEHGDGHGSGKSSIRAATAAKKARKEKPKETTVLHGGKHAEETDYQGRTYMHYPSTMKPYKGKCYIPQKQIYTWIGHSKGVNAIRFYPHSGHLLLSASMDKKVKIWDVHNKRRCLRSYLGHTGGVRDICFSNDGSRFLSVSYDRFIKLWDTETGQCISRFTSGKIPFCAKLHPEKPNEFLVGQSDKRVVQWDCSSGDITQSYEEHMGAVNSILFVDDNRRFVSTSDDKKVFVWEYGIPVVIKHIAEPDMHSMPVTTIHPSGKFFAGQSLDNQILVFGCKDKFKINRKKSFKGHQVAGYAAQINFSPDGNFLMSGDAEGRCFFWDWKTSRCYKKLKCHDQVTVGCEWNPVEPSCVATCSWDGTIKYWQ